MSNKEVSYYATGLSNTVTNLLEDDEYLQNENACRIILYLANMDYMPPKHTTDTMMTLLTTKKEETLVNYIIAVFHQLFERYNFYIEFNFDMIQSVLMSIDHFYNDVPIESGIIHIPIYNSISLLNYMVLVLEHLSQIKSFDNPIRTILERNRKANFFKSLFSVISKCDLEVFKNILKLISIMYSVLDGVVLRESITPQLCSDFRMLSDAKKVLFAQLMEKGTVKNRILEYILQDISNKKYAPAKMLNQEVAMDRMVGYYFRCTPTYNVSKPDVTRRPLEVFVITMNQLLQSILHSKQYSDTQDWSKALSEANDFCEMIKLEKDVDKVILINLQIIQYLIQQKSDQQKSSTSISN